MKSTCIASVLIWLCILPAAGSSAAKPLSVFAAASLTNVLADISKAAVADGLPPCRCVHAASSVLARQIVAGAPADIFVSANPHWVHHVITKDAAETEFQRVVAGNRLVLAAPAAAPFRTDLRTGSDLVAALGDGWLAMGDPDHVPAGIYGRAALEGLGVWARLTRRIARAGNVRGALALLERREVNAAVVYESDLRISDKVVLAGRFPPGTYPRISYVAVIVKGRATAVVRRYLKFLTSPTVRRLFSDHGFVAAGSN